MIYPLAITWGTPRAAAQLRKPRLRERRAALSEFVRVLNYSTLLIWLHARTSNADSPQKQDTNELVVIVIFTISPARKIQLLYLFDFRNLR
jgi:hypothetical protein